MSGELLENIKTLENQPSGKAGGFEGLVERLALLAKQAEDATAHAGTWDWLTLRESGIRAVLAELAKMGVEALPSEGAIAAELWEAAFPIIGKCDWRPCAQKMRAALVVAIAPILAAKDAELARLAEEIERSRAKAAKVNAWIEYEITVANEMLDDPQPEERQLGACRKRIVKRLKMQLEDFGAPNDPCPSTEAPSMNIMSPDD